jgi:Rrf2 family protein
MLSQTSAHALRAVLYLAQQEAGEVVPADVIAEALGAPKNYLSKTLNGLAKRGVLESTRGRTGGFRLNVPAERLTLARVIEPYIEHRPREVCLLGGRPCDDRCPCSVHDRWKSVEAQVWTPLASTTVADLLSGELVGEEMAWLDAGPISQAALVAWSITERSQK